MKIKINHPEHGTFEFETKPMPEARFKALCKLALAALYGGFTIGVTYLCGPIGLGVVAGVSVLLSLIWWGGRSIM